MPDRIGAIVRGLAQACRDVNCALIGGETGEMPGLYATINDFDLVGFVIGVVEKDKIIMGRNIMAGDAIIGLPSSGLHTNGYSLVRKIFGETKKALEKYYPELGRTLGEVLLEPHRCYYNQLKPHLSLVKGLAHITGGGLVGNVPRVLPLGLMAKFDTKKWVAPPIFKLIQKTGNIERGEMFHVFNMGIGMAVICAPENIKTVLKKLDGAMVVGEVVKQTGDARVMIDRVGYHKDKVA